MDWLLWDFDGTLGYHDGMWSRTLQEALAAQGVDWPLERIRPLMAAGFPWHTPEQSHEQFFGGVPWWDFMLEHFASLLRQQGLSADCAAAAAQSLRARYLAPSRWHLYDDTLPALRQACALGYRCAILSNHVPELPGIVNGLGLSGLLDQVVTSAQLGWEKPNPQFFRQATSLLGCERATMIGDNPNADVAGATAVGLNAILVRGERPADAGILYAPTLLDVFPLLSSRRR